MNQSTCIQGISIVDILGYNISESTELLGNFRSKHTVQTYGMLIKHMEK